MKISILGSWANKTVHTEAPAERAVLGVFNVPLSGLYVLLFSACMEISVVIATEGRCMGRTDAFEGTAGGGGSRCLPLCHCVPPVSKWYECEWRIDLADTSWEERVLVGPSDLVGSGGTGDTISSSLEVGNNVDDGL